MAERREIGESSTDNDQRAGSAILYLEIADEQREIRASLKAGELIIAAAFQDPKLVQVVRSDSTDLPSRKIGGEADDIMSLVPAAVCDRLKEIVGDEGVVRILMSAIRHLDDSSLNGQREPVRSILCSLKGDYLKELAPKPRVGMRVQ